ncbi:hypothetical protein HGP28_14570 [Vibrio sp. SM6]|uniref:Pilus assembly protein PilW n=1 Tax=Vibrio agarilyticus TaxID=2726741 RepID=A0A7X8TSJ5_9VIBR|nr:hypothetical protein [Vibrio agarilyticus]NLS14112.1 hypothetical protein [Vibrio agarilyticus]
MKNVHKKAIQGVSLVELLVASSLSLVVLGSVTSVFLSGFINSQKNAQTLMLQQNITGNMQILVEEVQRAGHGGLAAATLAGATRLVEFDTDAQWLALTMRYEFTDTNENVCYRYDSVRYEYRDNNLWHCTHQSTTSSANCVSAQPPAASDIRYCRRLFDENVMTISDFQIESQTVISASANTQRLTLALEGHSNADVSNHYRIERTFLLRNWQ